MRLPCSCSILLLCLMLLHLLAALPLQVYVLSPTSQQTELLELPDVDDLDEIRAPLDILQLVLNMYQLMQPIESQNPARSKKKKPPTKKPPPTKVVLNRLGFGNLSFTLGFSFNFQVSNSVGFGNNRQQSRLVINPEEAQRVNE